MEIEINDLRTIGEIQREFSASFPFLKIEFFDAAPVKYQALPKSKMYSSDKKLGTIRRKHSNGKIVINGKMTVSDLESELWKLFGLSAQVFRKSGNLWIETSLTDSWTLEQQNREGLEMSSGHKNPYKDDEENDFADRDKWE